MSGYLWKYYLQGDVANFRHVLESATYSTRSAGAQKSHGGGQASAMGLEIGSPGSSGTSPTLTAKGKRHDASPAIPFSAGITLTRADINYRDAFGRTLLHLAASSTSETAFEFAAALLDHPFTDLYLQDSESGWTALHRAFYAGHLSIAQAILARDSHDALGKGALHHSGGLIKIKDKEGNGPFDLLEMTLDDTVGLQPNAMLVSSERDDESALGDSVNLDADDTSKTHSIPHVNLGGDEVFTFGSNKNVTLGFGDEDDRQFPERIVLRRPEHLYHRFYREHVESRPSSALDSSNADLSQSGIWSIAELPAVVLNKPICIQDTQMSKLHSAIVTTDPESNLFICGHGSSGRIGIGDETTRYHFACIEGGALAHKRVASVALGQNHTLALSSEGEIFSWGSNGCGQLGYALPKAPGKDEAVQTLPRQIFGPLKKEIVIGIAASRLHSVAHTSSSLYTFGKNEGQLGIVDSDARSLEIQETPRKVAASLFSVPIAAVSAIDRATICLLENHEVWVFTNYGYAKVQFPLESFSNYFIQSSLSATNYDRSPNVICNIVSGGDTICALSSHGEIYTVAVSQPSSAAPNPTPSTSNLSKIRGALSPPQRVWSNKKSHMAARDVDVDQNGSIILVTHAGSVWRRVKRAKIKDASAAGTGEYKPKDYKFSRISGLTRVSAVRASGFGAYAAVREDCTKTRKGIDISPRKLWIDIQPLMPFRLPGHDSEPLNAISWVAEMTQFLLDSKDLDRDLDRIVQRDPRNCLPYDMVLRLPTREVEIPVHCFILTARSKVIRHALEAVDNISKFVLPDILTIYRGDNGSFILELQDIDTYALFNLVLYLYSDRLINFTHLTAKDKWLNYRYKQTRPELLKLAAKLELSFLESAVKRFADVPHTLDREMERAIRDPIFFDSGDIIVQLADDEVRVHGALVCQRCPFFEGLFKGRAGGQWLSERKRGRKKSHEAIRVDLGHINSQAFDKVLRHIYADTGLELFDDVVADNLDEFLDKVIEVLGVANELMLDRLAEICQTAIGKYVTVRNVCQLVNVVAPCSVQAFKKRALEYICLDLEAVLQNGHLEDLDDDLLIELDGVSRQLQRECSLVSRSGVLEAGLLERHPDLQRRVDQEGQAKIDSIHVLNKYADIDSRTSTSFKAGSFHELSETSLPQRMRRRSSKGSPSPGASPALKGKASIQDLLFNMDEEDEDELSRIPPLRESDSQPTTPKAPANEWQEVGRRRSAAGNEMSMSSPPAGAQMKSEASSRDPGRPWGVSPLPSSKLNMKAMLDQASSSRTSNISLSLSAQPRATGSFKMSQKERKRMQQAALQQPTKPVTAAEPSATPKSTSPWQILPLKAKPVSPSVTTNEAPPKGLTSKPPELTTSQTIEDPSGVAKDNTTTSTNSSQRRAVSGSIPAATPPALSASTPNRAQGLAASALTSQQPQPQIQSIRHTPKPASKTTSTPSVPYGLKDILDQEQASKDKLKEAVAPRSLQDIQQEQAFQEWWDKESKKAIAEEKAKNRDGKKAARNRRGRGRTKGKEAKGEENKAPKEASATTTQAPSDEPKGPKTTVHV